MTIYVSFSIFFYFTCPFSNALADQKRINFDQYLQLNSLKDEIVCLPDEPQGEICYVPHPFEYEATSKDDPERILNIKGEEENAQNFSRLHIYNMITQEAGQGYPETYVKIDWKGVGAGVELRSGKLVVLGKIYNKVDTDGYEFQVLRIHGLLPDFPIEFIEGGVDLEAQFGYSFGAATHRLIVDVQTWTEQIISKALNAKAEWSKPINQAR